jgi:uncharacterized protein (UPF0332 family)
MSNQPQKELVQYWFNKANESLESAKSEFCENRLTFAVNRLYYAMFYSVTALLTTQGVNPSKHAAVRAAFHRDFVHTNLIEKKFGRLYDELFHARHQGDYMPMIDFEPDIVQQQINDVEAFLKVVKPMI